MGTWKLVDKPRNIIPISNKFMFTKKWDKDRNLLKYKARLVAKGYAQHPGYDYVDTHSPVIRLETIQVIFVASEACDCPNPDPAPPKITKSPKPGPKAHL